MDLWVVAAAAGAGYVAKNLQNLSVDKRESSGGASLKYSYNIQSESRNLLQQLRDKTCPLRRLARQGFQENSLLDVENHSDVNFSEIDRLSSRDREEGVEESLKFAGGEDRNFSRVSKGKLVRNRKCHVHSTRPLNSLGSRVEDMEQGSCLRPSMSVARPRPVLVTDGRWRDNSSFAELDGCREASSSPTKQFESVEGLRKQKNSSNNLQLSGSKDSISSRSQVPETMVLLITGMTVGILSATTSWKNEADKLNKQLKKMENLVQDLHEELDMKEMLMVEPRNESDLPSEQKDTTSSIEEPISSPSDEKNAENLELLSRIEAELQAELEMLEHNMKASAPERISSVVEIDADFELEIVEGDLKPKMVDATESGNETTDTTTDCSKPANYAVSPRELSLRLYELIESRLERRIKELEMALGENQNLVSGRRISYSETESSSTCQSPTCICDEHDKKLEKPATENFSSNENGILLRLTDRDQEEEDVQQIWDKQRSTCFMSNEDSTSDDEGSNESDMLLIKQIVERRRSSSSSNFKIC